MKNVCFALPTMEQVSFAITPEDEIISIEQALSFKETGADHSRYIKKVQRDNGNNIWLWCSVKVTATYKGCEGTAYLGGCAYENEADFIKGGYLEQMKDEAFEELISELEAMAD